MQTTDKVTKGQRQFHTEEKSKYWLPMDNEEVTRLNKQHHAIKELFGGNVPQPVHEFVHSRLEKGGKFLDLCCGTGIYITEIAMEYPETECVGIDMVDVFQKNDTVKNVSFTQGNLLEGFPFKDNTFDVVSLNFGICAFTKEEWIVLMKEANRVLQPGGYFINKEPGRLNSDRELAKLTFKMFEDKATSLGQVYDITDQLTSILLEARFDEAGSVTKSVYIGRPGRFNELHRLSVVRVFKGMLPTLSKDLNISSDKHDELLEKLNDDLNEPNCNFQFAFTYGKKPTEFKN